MDDNISWTPSPEENLLGLTDKEEINRLEAQGLTTAEVFVFELDTGQPISTTLILKIHRIAFGRLYDWAGKWRDTEVVVGQLIPPLPIQVLQSMYQFIDNLNFKISISDSRQQQIECLVFAHYEFIRIHPFKNGNGRTGRILMNLVAMQFGYQPLALYHREGASRKIYIEAMKLGDNGDYRGLFDLISKELVSF